MSVDQAREARRLRATALIGSDGWEALQEEINFQIDCAAKDLRVKAFKDLREVDRLQERIDTLKKVFDFPLSGLKK